ncbi:MAG TPA: MBL fold metallo-hydrolase [Propionibacteriaceae bacterium]
MSSCGPWEANCYLVGAADTDECVVIDAGMDASSVVERLLAESNRTPVAVLASHGHLDHVADAHAVADAHGVPVWIHPADRHLLTDPGAGLGPQGAELVRTLYGSATWPEPSDVREWHDGDEVTLAGVTFRVVEAPGHTPGCVLLLASVGDTVWVFTGDVVFAGSIGRTDLPGGDMATMAASLRDKVLTLSDDVPLLPGHGPSTTVARERATNPYLQASFLEQFS